MSVFTADFSTNYLGSISCETSSPLLLLVWVARTKLNSKTNLERFSSLPSIFGYLGKETKNTAELVIIKNIFIYARVYVNKEVIHSGSLGLISGKHARYVIVRVSYVKSCNELAVEGPCNTSCFKIVDSLLPMLKPLKPILFVETPNAYREFPRRSAHANKCPLPKKCSPPRARKAKNWFISNFWQSIKQIHVKSNFASFRPNITNGI